MEENNNKKVLVPTIIAVVTLVILTVGATYAYFKVATDNEFGTPKIEASTPSIGSVALSTGSNLTMNLTAEEMMEKDTNVTYYASPSGTTTEAYTENIGTATVTGSGSYTCTYILTIDDNVNSLYDKFQTGYANKSAGQIVLTVNGVEYDFNTAGLFPKEISGTMSGLTASAPQYITAQLKLVNSKSIDQSNLSGQNITLTFGVEDFSCTAESEPLALCIRATELHQEECTDTEFACNMAGYGYYDGVLKEKGTHITYGNLGTKGEELVSGDALTCDVNGDGTYDEETERFYYVSDYYNTTTKQFESDKAALIYYKNTGNVTAYSAYGYNYSGPVTAVTQLPKNTEWSNVSLINAQRAIIDEENRSSFKVIVGEEEYDTENLPTAFDYSAYSARLLTYQELKAACPSASASWDSMQTCEYFFEQAGYSNISSPSISGRPYWMETPKVNLNSDEVVEDFNNAFLISGYDSATTERLVNETSFGVRPVIEVYKTDIDN